MSNKVEKDKEKNECIKIIIKHHDMKLRDCGCNLMTIYEIYLVREYLHCRFCTQKFMQKLCEKLAQLKRGGNATIPLLIMCREYPCMLQ